MDRRKLFSLLVGALTAFGVRLKEKPTEGHFAKVIENHSAILQPVLPIEDNRDEGP